MSMFYSGKLATLLLTRFCCLSGTNRLEQKSRPLTWWSTLQDMSVEKTSWFVDTCRHSRWRQYRPLPSQLVIILSHHQITCDISRRSAITCAAMQSLENHIWRSRLAISTNLKLYNTCILPIFLYGSDCWVMSKTDARKINALDQWCLRMLLGIKWYQFVRNDDVRRLTKQPKLTAIIESRRLTLFGHIMRMDDNTDAKRILLASPPADWRRQLGRPRITWLSTIQQDLKHHHLTLITILRSTNQQIWLRTAIRGGWCRRMALRNRELHARNDDDHQIVA